MEGLATLLSLAIVMAVISFLAGLLPLSFPLAPTHLRLISTVGMGVLIGTSLVVIIPEGVDALYDASLTSNARIVRASGSSLAVGHFQDPRRSERGNSDDRDSSIPAPAERYPLVVTTLPSSSSGIKRSIRMVVNQRDDGGDMASTKAVNFTDESPHAWIGVALITGFILMYIIDQLPRYAITSETSAQPYHISLNDLSRGLHRGPLPEHDSETDGFLQTSREGQGRSRSFATTTGLVIHAAADGIALGASSTSADTGFSFIIFLAIMVHKAPAAFGLSSVLLKQGLSKRTARAHLLLFSLATPTGAILTWLFAHSLGAGAMENAQNTKWWTAMLLLFSGGTFLYVAMHAMQEVGTSPELQMNEQVNGAVEGREGRCDQKKLSAMDLAAAIFGMVLPLFLRIGHAH